MDISVFSYWKEEKYLENWFSMVDSAKSDIKSI